MDPSFDTGKDQRRGDGNSAEMVKRPKAIENRRGRVFRHLIRHDNFLRDITEGKMDRKVRQHLDEAI